ncbi:MAG TPA: hypothetical protein VGK59_19410 [Ohtaekwangia sp.]
MLNLLLAAGWLSVLTSQTGSDDSLGIDELFWAALFIRFLYALQGLLLFARPLKKWDLVSSGILLAAVAYFAFTLGSPGFLYFAIPVVIYGCLQVIRNKIPDNVKIAYLNVWNILFVFLSTVDQFTNAF